MASKEYHLQELAIAKNRHDSRHVMPPIDASQQRILDLGCGAGQTLIAASLAPGAVAVGIDVDWESLRLGREWSDQIHFIRARGEHLPFHGGYFDMVFSRVAIPYMHLEKALAEMQRVLKNGGMLWATLHPFDKTRQEMQADVARLDFKSALYRLFVMANGLTLHLRGKQFSSPLRRGSYESCQTRRGITLALRAAGFINIEVRHEKFLIVTARKPAA